MTVNMDKGFFPLCILYYYEAEKGNADWLREWSELHTLIRSTATLAHLILSSEFLLYDIGTPRNYEDTHCSGF